MTALAADIGGTRIKLALVGSTSVLAHRLLDARSDAGLAPQLPRVAQAFEALRHETGVTPDECNALVVAFPSLIDPQSQRVRAAYGKYMDAPTLDLADWARITFGLPLILENDARMALLGEWKFGAGKGANNLVMVTLGTGLGTAALIEGHMVRGTHGQAGALGGHFTVEQTTNLCTCGNLGCAEREMSSAALPTLAAAHPEYQDSVLKQCDSVDFLEVFRAARSGDGCAVSLRARAINIWASLVVNLIHAYDPERVILGGGIMAGDADFFPELRQRVLERAHTPWGQVSFVRGELGDAAALMGGAFLAHERTEPQA